MGRCVREPFPAEVDEVRAKVERWRQQRKCLGPIPKKLWAEAAEMAPRFGMNLICHHLGLSYAALKTRMGKRLGLKPSVLKQNPVPQPKPRPKPVTRILGLSDPPLTPAQYYQVVSGVPLARRAWRAM
jgi:hypothetical protein